MNSSMPLSYVQIICFMCVNALHKLPRLVLAGSMNLNEICFCMKEEALCTQWEDRQQMRKASHHNVDSAKALLHEMSFQYSELYI